MEKITCYLRQHAEIGSLASPMTFSYERGLELFTDNKCVCLKVSVLWTVGLMKLTSDEFCSNHH